ncbi:MAG: type II secretion system F family protein [Frankiaceae bacterium]
MAPHVALLAGLGAVFAGLVLGIGAIGVFSEERRQVGRSLAAIRALHAAPVSMRREIDQPFGERVVDPTLKWLARLAGRFGPEGQAARLRQRLDLAGNPPKWDPERVLAFKSLGLITGVVVGGGAGYLLKGTPFAIVLGIVALGALGFFVPNMTLYQISENRRERMERELPDAIDLLTISVEAGLAFDAALAQVARNTEGPLAEEFFRVLQEMQIGVGRTAALRALSERSSLPDLRAFVTAMVQADGFGIPISNVLRVQAKEMRIKRSQRAEEKAQKVPIKILFPLIFCILPSLFIVVIGPAAITVVRQLFTRL